MMASVHKEHINIPNTPATIQGCAERTNPSLHGVGSSILATPLMCTGPLKTLEQAAIHDFRKCSCLHEILEVMKNQAASILGLKATL